MAYRLERVPETQGTDPAIAKTAFQQALYLSRTMAVEADVSEYRATPSWLPRLGRDAQVSGALVVGD